MQLSAAGHGEWQALGALAEPVDHLLADLGALTLCTGQNVDAFEPLRSSESVTLLPSGLQFLFSLFLLGGSPLNSKKGVRHFLER